jgi:hypothetical protein
MLKKGRRKRHRKHVNKYFGKEVGKYDNRGRSKIR